MPAIWTLFGNWLRRRGELALRVISAAVKSVALARALFDEFAFLAFRALHADEVLLHIFAVGISAARSELAVTAVPQDQVALAQRAGFIERNVGHSLALIEPPRRLAPAIPIAKRRGVSIRARRSPTFRSMKPAPCASAT